MGVSRKNWQSWWIGLKCSDTCFEILWKAGWDDTSLVPQQLENKSYDTWSVRLCHQIICEHLLRINSISSSHTSFSHTVHFANVWKESKNIFKRALFKGSGNMWYSEQDRVVSESFFVELTFWCEKMEPTWLKQMASRDKCSERKKQGNKQWVALELLYMG